MQSVVWLSLQKGFHFDSLVFFFLFVVVVVFCNIRFNTGYNLVRQFSLLQRLSVISNFHRDCLTAETAVHDTWLPAASVRVILLLAASLARKHNHADSLGKRKMADQFIPCVQCVTAYTY